MKQIFVNLKRFDVPRKLGGVCPLDDPIAWIESVMDQTVELGLGAHANLALTYLLPEGLVAAAARRVAKFPVEQREMLAIGVQGVHWDDVRPGKNFGAFTTSVPAVAATNLGSQWAIIGHSEERRAKFQIISAYDQTLNTNAAVRAHTPAARARAHTAAARAAAAIDQLVHDEVQCALGAGLRVLMCVGESAEERGDGAFEEQQPRIEKVLRAQVLNGLRGAEQFVRDGKIVIGYEPIWAIGPGKTPPGKEYIAFVSAFVRRVVRENFGADVVVVYGGGLKEENAAMIASIETIGGGLVALTQFTGEIGFDVAQLNAIVAKYLA
ncbi:MAG: triose-phosphate isomerase [Chloroflexota bacterium]